MDYLWVLKLDGDTLPYRVLAVDLWTCTKGSNLLTLKELGWVLDDQSAWAGGIVIDVIETQKQALINGESIFEKV